MKNNKSLETYFGRMRELSDIGDNKKQHTNLNTTLVEHAKTNDGTVLGIVKDAHHYFIKKTTSQDANLTESHFAFIGGLENKNEHRFDSLGDAQKQINLYIKSINENFSKNKKISESKKQILSEDKKLSDPNSWIRSVISEGKNQEKVDNFNRFKESMNLNESKDINEDDNIEDNLEDTSDALEDLSNNIKSDEAEGEALTDDGEETSPEEVDGGEEEIPKKTDDSEDDLDTEKGDGEEDLNLDDLDLGDGEDLDIDKAEDDSSDDSSSDEGDDGAEIKEMEKLIGKLTHKVRNSDLTPDQTKSFMNSLLSSFENEISDLKDHVKKEMADKILKSKEELEGEEGEISEEDYRDEKGEVPGEQDTGPDEYEEEKPCDDCGNFDSYVSDRGYDDTENVTPMEIANIISGFIDSKEELSDDDLNEVAKYCTEEVVGELGEYGYVDEMSKLEPYIKQINEEDGMMKFGGVQADFDPDDIDVDLKEDDEFGNDMEDEIGDTVEDVLGDNSIAPETMPAPAETMGVASPSTSTLNINAKTGDATLTVNEEKERKIRKYIRNRIEEKISNKKPSLNESKKSNKMKKLDTLIDKTLFKLTK
jgi:hypothetical protein